MAATQLYAQDREALTPITWLRTKKIGQYNDVEGDRGQCHRLDPCRQIDEFTEADAHLRALDHEEGLVERGSVATFLSARRRAQA